MVVWQKILLRVLVVTLIVFSAGTIHAQLKIGNNPMQVHPSSILELESDSAGFLLPRIADTALMTKFNPPDGMLIYFTPTTGKKGLYIRENGKWVLVGSGGSAPATAAPRATLAIRYTDPISGANITNANHTMEMMAAGSAINAIITWTAGRAATTEPLSKVTVAGKDQTFTQPAAGANTAPADIAVTIKRNENTSFTNNVVTTDNKPASASVSVSFLNSRYWGFLPVAADVDSTTLKPQIGTLSKELSSGAGFSKTSSPGGTQKRLILAFPARFDNANIKIIISNYNQTSAFKKTSFDVTNASGFTEKYIVYIQANSTASPLDFSVQ